MNDPQRCVADFHRAMGLPAPASPTLPLDEDRANLRAVLIREEATETILALRDGDTLAVIDGLCDLLYVTLGTAVEMGVDLTPHFAEVHRANMRKVGGPVRADGKQLKPADWTPPDHESILSAAV